MTATDLSSLANFTQDISSSVTATLAAHQNNLTLTGTSAINGTGNGHTTYTNEAFSFIGNTVAFTGAGQLRMQDNVLYGNTDTDSEAEFAIKLVGVPTLAATDFIL